MESTAPDHGSSEIPHARGDARGLGRLFADLWRETTTLVRNEAELAKADMSEKVDQALAGIGSIAAGGAVLFAGFIVLLLCITNALAMVLPIEFATWLAPLIVGVVVMLAGYAILSHGRRELKARNLRPSRSIDSLRRDGRLVKEHLQ
ncbi:MAG: phage holin family protein [Betaproteobacteria bacterium]